MRTFIAAALAASAYASGMPGVYDYSQGGANWKDQPQSSGKRNDCGNVLSQKQSPIDLTYTATESEKLSLTMTDYTLGTKVPDSNNEDEQAANWQVLSSGGKMTRTDTTTTVAYKSRSFHFHTPSEHTVNGASYDAEMHFVHQSSVDSSYAVVGIFFDQDAGSDDNLFLTNFFAGYDSMRETGAKQLIIDPTMLLTGLATDDVWMYDGSFTTPPCTEGVAWTVIKQVQNISSAQLTKFAQFTKGAATDEDLDQSNLEAVQVNTANAGSAAGNNRKIQPLNARTVYMAKGMVADGASALFASAAIAAISLLAF